MSSLPAPNGNPGSGDSTEPGGADLNSPRSQPFIVRLFQSENAPSIAIRNDCSLVRGADGGVLAWLIHRVVVADSPCCLGGPEFFLAGYPGFTDSDG